MYPQTVICEKFISQSALYAYIIIYFMVENKYLCDLRDNIPLFTNKNNKNIFILLNHLQIQIEILLL